VCSASSFAAASASSVILNFTLEALAAAKRINVSPDVRTRLNLYSMAMTVSKLLHIALLLTALCLPARATQTGRSGAQTRPAEDKLARHLSAAETFQLSGDLKRAGEENLTIAAIALARLGAIAIRERQLQRAVQLLSDSLTALDDSQVRTDLAIARMRLLEVDKALAEARAAVALDEKNARAHHVLGKLLYMKSDYEGARRELERAVVLEQDLDAAYTLGMSYLRLKDSARAKLLFEDMQVALSNSADAHLLFGRAYEETGFSSEAEREFRTALAIDPRAPRAHFYLGYVILQHGGSERLAQAGEEFERELQLHPQDFYANFFLGVVAANIGEHQKAVRYLSEAARIKPDSGSAYLFLGQSQAELGDPAAEKSLRRAIELTPDVSQNSFQIKRAHYLLGRVLLKAGRREESEKEMTIARGLQAQSLENSRQEVGEILGQVVKTTSAAAAPSQIADASGKSEENASDAGGESGVLLIEESALEAREAEQIRGLKGELSAILAQAYHNLGVIAAQAGQLAAALEQFDAAARWKPDLEGLDRNLGIIAFRAAQYEKAVAPLARQLKAHPEDALARRMLGVSFYLTRDFRQAVETLKPLESSITADAELAYAYGISLVQLADNDKASAVFARLSTEHPKDAQARSLAAQGFMLTGDYERALAEFRAIGVLDPRAPQAHYNAGQSLIRLNRLDEAEREFRQELQLNPADEASKYHLAYVLLEQKRQTAEALGLLREVVAARPDYADARYQLGKALIEQGDVASAIENLEAAARAEPKKDYVHYQLSIAYRRASRTSDAERELQLYKELKAANRSPAPQTTGAKQDAP
jgi:tetratricopeptide (TPR) repeat protein